MLPGKFRLLGEKNFKRVYQKGHTWQGRFLRIAFLRKLSLPPRFGFVISAKALSAASARNLLKRKLRHRVGDYLKKNSPLPPFDVVVGVRRGIKKEHFGQAVEELEQWLKKFFWV
ncbi:ribonuclease P protein component [Candidatus Berkelbacteria bacterium]|nr:ribonuclease P protein component [Candidatus Berkelbacteria bacterium]